MDHPMTPHARQARGRRFRVGLLVWLLAPSTVAAQIPDSFTNLQVLPPDIYRDSLLAVMSGFSLALGVDCQYCHVGGDGLSFAGVRFDSDDDPDKVKARFMLGLVERLNTELLPQLPDRDSPPASVSCKTCHRGVPRPLLLTQEMRLALDTSNVEAAVERYRTLREDFLTSGTYDFGEWEVNTFAESLAADRPEDAIAIFELNLEHFARSPSILRSLGDLYPVVGDTARAIASLERALELRPGDPRVEERLRRLRGR